MPPTQANAHGHGHGKFKILGATNLGEGPKLSNKQAVNLKNMGFRKQEEPERFWPADNEEYIGWKKARVRDYFNSFPCWKPFCEQWKDMSEEEKINHGGLPSKEEFGQDNIPNPNVATSLTSTRYYADVRGFAGSDKMMTCWEQFNDAYEGHLRGLPTSQTMNLLGVASATCPAKLVDRWLGQISKGTFDGRKSIRNIIGDVRHAHGHH